MYCWGCSNYYIRLSCHNLTQGDLIYESSRNFPCYIVLLNVINTMKISLYYLTFWYRTQKRFTYISVFLYGTEMLLYIFPHSILWVFQKCILFLACTCHQKTKWRIFSGTPCSIKLHRHKDWYSRLIGPSRESILHRF